MADALGDVRKQLDTVDRRIVEALAERLRLVDDVAEAKGQEAASLRDREREEEILGRLAESARDVGIDESFLLRLYREIMDHSLRRQRALLDEDRTPGESPEILVVGYQGTEGAYSHVAATRHFGGRGGDVVYRGYDTFEEIGVAVQEGDIDRGMLPVENTTAGSINDVYDLLAACDLSIVGEEVQVVDHCLMAPEGATLAGIRRIYSHPQALLQCSRFLARQAHTQAESYTDTAMAARKVRNDGQLTHAAIASEEAARLYGLSVLRRGIAKRRRPRLAQGPQNDSARQIRQALIPERGILGQSWLLAFAIDAPDTGSTDPGWMAAFRYAQVRGPAGPISYCFCICGCLLVRQSVAAVYQ